MDKKERKKKLDKLMDDLMEIMEDDIPDILAEEDEYLGSIPEDMRSGEQYEKSVLAHEYLDNSIGHINSAIENIKKALDF